MDKALDSLKKRLAHALAWWQLRSQREQYLIACALLMLLLTVCYSMVWLPWQHYNQTLSDQIRSNQGLSQLLNQAHGRQSAKVHKAIPLSLSQLETSLARYPALQSQVQFKQLANSRWQLNFNKVNFDLLSAWLGGILQHYRVFTTQLKVHALNSLGLVNAELELANSPQNNTAILPELAKWHLFGGQTTDADYPMARLPLHLIGVLSLGQKSQAILTTPDAESKNYSLGDTIPGGAILYQVLADGIIVQYEGKLAKVSLPKYRED